MDSKTKKRNNNDSIDSREKLSKAGKLNTKEKKKDRVSDDDYDPKDDDSSIPMEKIFVKDEKESFFDFPSGNADDDDKSFDKNFIMEGACRLCLQMIESNPIPLWGSKKSPYAKKIFQYCSVKVTKHDKLTALCPTCISKLDNMITFRKMCIANNEILLNLDIYKQVKCNDDDVYYESDVKIEYERDTNDITTEDSEAKEDHSCDKTEEYVSYPEVSISERFKEKSKEYSCYKCPMICLTLPEYKVHCKSHFEKKWKKRNELYVCPVYGCNKEFKSYKYTMEHKLAEHKDRKIAQCASCGLMFKKISDMNLHSLRIHGSNPKVSCQKCGKGVPYLYMKIHNGMCLKERKLEPCPQCGKKFNRKRFVAHLREVHNEREKFSCTFCSRKFGNAHNFRTHLRTHTGEMPYPCPDCTETFRHRVTMKHHRLRVHNVNMFDNKISNKKTILN